jgi:hypothetical protein
MHGLQRVIYINHQASSHRGSSASSSKLANRESSASSSQLIEIRLSIYLSRKDEYSNTIVLRITSIHFTSLKVSAQALAYYMITFSKRPALEIRSEASSGHLYPTKKNTVLL